MAPVQNIFINSVNWIGDAVMTTPALRCIRRGYPQARLVVAARPWVSSLFEDNPDVDEIWLENGHASRRELLARLRERRFELGFSFPNSFRAAWLLWAGRVRRRIGYARDLRSPLLTDPVRCTPEILRRHQVDYYVNLLRPVMAVGEGRRELVLPLNPGAAQRVTALLARHGVKAEERLLGVNPGAFYGAAKRWLPERFAEAAGRLARKNGWRIVLLGTKKERAPVAELATRCNPPALNLAGETDLKEAVALIDRLSFLLTNDSGAMHLAAARGVPLVAIFGSTDWRTTYPYHPAARVVRRETPCAPCLLRECPIDHRCMTRVSVEAVLEAAEAVLAQGASSTLRPPP